jgi:hypothetical protein
MSGAGRARELGLDFAHAPGPLVTIRAATPGAGASTLAWILAREAARESSAPVLLAELDATAGGLARLAQASSSRALHELTEPGRRATGPPFAALTDGPRLIARSTPTGAWVDPAALGGVLAKLRQLHSLTVVDCGSDDGDVVARALALATHHVMVLELGAGWVDRERLTPHARAAEQPRPRTTLCLLSGPVGMRPDQQVQALATLGFGQIVLLPRVRRPEDPGAARPGGPLALALSALACQLHEPPE